MVVYESMFGNTELIAEAIGEGLRERMDVEVHEVGGVDSFLPEDLALLVVGGPTHVFGMSRPNTRDDAAGQTDGPIVSRDRGIREWLAEITGTRPPCATFDTKVVKPKLPGSASGAAMKVLRRHGLKRVAPPETFYVESGQGPLAGGELERARRWGAGLAGLVVGTRAGVTRR